jgi:hypothetical protein
MEHLVRVQNERDRRTLAWLREKVGDAAIVAAAQRHGPSKPYLSAVCRTLGVTAPRFSVPYRLVPSAAADHHPADTGFPGRPTGADARARLTRIKTPPGADAVTIM